MLTRERFQRFQCIGIAFSGELFEAGQRQAYAICRGLLSGGRIMSRFNTDCLCVQCEQEERQHPDYEKAAEAEFAAVRRGETNYPGIGWPGKDGRIK